jgi:hypothetical protein
MGQLRGIVRKQQSGGAFRENVGAHRKDVGGAGKVAEVRESGRRCGKMMADVERRSGMRAEGQEGRENIGQ